MAWKEKSHQLPLISCHDEDRPITARLFRWCHNRKCNCNLWFDALCRFIQQQSCPMNIDSLSLLNHASVPAAVVITLISHSPQRINDTLFPPRQISVCAPSFHQYLCVSSGTDNNPETHKRFPFRKRKHVIGYI
ncbi:hypothetical protein Q9L58_006443 [Maublancomyces gigas]|uniref:Uncharacterized protein n=1 Tax=Discina gigas TaxID=1032678 RepID=A0ABR3GFB3_9PEZI